MALIFKGIPCSICGKEIEDPRRDVVATSHFITDQSDPLWKYSDSAMHRACFDTWEHRDEFTRRFKEYLRKARSDNFGDIWPERS